MNRYVCAESDTKTNRFIYTYTSYTCHNYMYVYLYTFLDNSAGVSIFFFYSKQFFLLSSMFNPDDQFFFSFLTTPEPAIITVPTATYNTRLYYEPAVAPNPLIKTIHAIVWSDCRRCRDTTHSVTHNAINALLCY